MTKLILLGIIMAASAGFEVCRSQTSTDTATVPMEVDQIVEQMRGFSMQMRGTPQSDGTIDPLEQRKEEVKETLRGLGEESVPALARALSDTDVQMRRNAALVLIYLAGAQPKLDIRKGLRELIKATEDSDPEVRAWAAHALAEIGPDAKEAIPALLKLLNDREEGPRNTSCMALGRIGVAAKDALPALRAALNDPSNDVRRFAQEAIDRIQQESPGELSAPATREPVSQPAGHISFKCSQPTAQQESLIRDAAENKYWVRRVEFVGNARTRDNVLRRMITLQEGDVFTRENLVRSLENVSTLKKIIYPVKLSDVIVHLDTAEKMIDLTICFRERPRP